MENEEVIFQIILHSGDARENIIEAIKVLQDDNIKESYECLEKANQCLNKAHKVQSTLIFDEINGEGVSLSLLMVHAQDHLMTTMAMRDFAKEIVKLYECKLMKGERYDKNRICI